MSKILYYVAENPEDNAMLQAMYSRSDKSIEERIKDLESLNSGKFMEQHYVGYGHGSIGDCGAVTLYIEEVSMLASVAIQHHQLYNGQEMSTRYIDFRNQGFYNPLAGTDGEDVFAQQYEKFRAFYVQVQDELIEKYSQEYPYSDYEKDGVSERVWKNAVKAKALDVAREFIPVCTHTSLSLHGNISAVRDNVFRLLSYEYDGLGETTEIAKGLLKVLREKVPNSIGTDEAIESYVDSVPASCFRVDPGAIGEYGAETSFPLCSVNDPGILRVVEPDLLNSIKVVDEENSSRRLKLPIGSALLAPRLSTVGIMTYGGYRDVHRHRTLYRDCSTPMLIDSKDAACLKHLSDESRKQFENLVDETLVVLDKYDASVSNYLGILGTPIAMVMDGPFDAWNYFVSLRSGPSVHPDVRKLLRGLVVMIEERIDEDGFGEHSKHYMEALVNAAHPSIFNEEDDGLYIERGKQTIEKKQ